MAERRESNTCDHLKAILSEKCVDGTVAAEKGGMVDAVEAGDSGSGRPCAGQVPPKASDAGRSCSGCGCKRMPIPAPSAVLTISCEPDPIANTSNWWLPPETTRSGPSGLRAVHGLCAGVGAIEDRLDC